MDYNQAALQMHEEHHGKVAVQSKVKVENRDDLSTAYTPAVAKAVMDCAKASGISKLGK